MGYSETIKYIKKQASKGADAGRIKKVLSEAGYQQEIIDELIEKAGVFKSKKEAKGIEKIILKDVTIGVVLLLVFGSLAYFSFFKDGDKEFFSPKTSGDIKLSLSKVSPLKIEKNGHSIIDLNKYFRDSKYDYSEMRWKHSGQICINVRENKDKIILRSVFLPGCSLQETINFEVMNPSGKISSDTIKVKIV
ncbi:hypothetical protein CEE44_02560 [Candidatus Woesearchaeota archaeon B3_Woes]|nr:MAG: hypothetical protein CEE44_02560 [Candidatus Woesearchaeota archaeon B3_Woes]